VESTYDNTTGPLVEEGSCS